MPAAPARPRVLLIRPDHLGDLLMTSPAIELLRKALPEAHLTMMIGPWVEEIARRDPLLDELLPCPFPGFTRAPKSSLLDPYLLLWQMARTVRQGHYDAALLLRFDHWWGAWLTALAGIPIRVGHSVPECRPFLTHAVGGRGSGRAELAMEETMARPEPRPPDTGQHWVERSLDVVRGLLGVWGVPRDLTTCRPPLRFAVRDEDEREVDHLLTGQRAVDERPLVAFHPGTGSSLKLWPEERWIALGWLLASKGAQLLVTGGDGERMLAERIAAKIPDARSLAGKTALGPLAALFGRCRLVVGVDNGPLHLAVARGVPTIQLFGPTDAQLFGPWGDPIRHRVVTSNWPGAPCGRLDLAPPRGCHAPCMEAITVDQVARECLRLLGGQGSD